MKWTMSFLVYFSCSGISTCWAIRTNDTRGGKSCHGNVLGGLKPTSSSQDAGKGGKSGKSGKRGKGEKVARVARAARPVRNISPPMFLQINPIIYQLVYRLLPHHPSLLPVRALHLQINLACHLLQRHLSQMRLLALVPVLGLLSPKCRAEPHLQHQASRLYLASFPAPRHLNRKLRVMIQAQRPPSRCHQVAVLR